MLFLEKKRIVQKEGTPFKYRVQAFVIYTARLSHRGTRGHLILNVFWWLHPHVRVLVGLAIKSISCGFHFNGLEPNDALVGPQHSFGLLQGLRGGVEYYRDELSVPKPAIAVSSLIFSVKITAECNWCYVANTERYREITAYLRALSGIGRTPWFSITLTAPPVQTVDKYIAAITQMT